MHQSRAGPYQALTHPMERLDVLLVNVLDRHKPHGGPCHRFANPFGITHVIFMRLAIGLDKLRRHELDFVPMFAKASRPVMCPATGFHADEHRGQLRSTGYQVMPGQALAQDDLAPLIHSHHVKHALCNVDPEDVHLWLHWTRLLWLYEFTDLALIVAHRSRAAQGAGPFHYDLIKAQLAKTLAGTNFANLGSQYKGKVRDCYTRDGRRIIVVTDRISAFDVVLGTIPFKGQVLNQIAAYWFKATGHLAPNHVIDVPDPTVMLAT